MKIKKAAYRKRPTFLLVGLLLLGALLVWILAGQRQAPGCPEAYRHDKNLNVNGYVIETQTATTSAQQEKGLGGRACIGANQGMLFVFSKVGYYPFWMKDMKFPLDIIWISTSKQAVNITANLQSSSYPNSFVNQQPAQYVLEIAAGQAKKFNIQTGTQFIF